MASSPEFVRFLCDQLAGAGSIASRKMFGEYGLYCDGKFFALVCDDRLFLKPTEAGRAFLPGCPLAPPYDGAKDHLCFPDPDDRETLCELARRTCSELPAPKPKKPRKTKNSAPKGSS